MGLRFEVVQPMMVRVVAALLVFGRYRKKKDLEKAQAAFAPVAAAKAADNQATTVVKLTRIVHQPDQDTSSATSVTGFLPPQQQQQAMPAAPAITSPQPSCHDAAAVLAMQLATTGCTVSSQAGDAVYAVNHQGVHFQVLNDQQSASATATATATNGSMSTE
jgi:hypothetical protein